MYDYIKGKITEVHPEYVTLECRDIGYKLQTPNPFAFHVNDETIKVYTYLHVRDDIHSLIGFQTMRQRQLFEKLITVSGIGPKGALAILANGIPEQVAEAIEREDEKFLVQFPGVGKKTARQMILDLKGKLDDLFGDLFEPNEAPSLASNYALEEAMLALQALGYSERELKKIETTLQQQEMTTEAYMKEALRLLVKQS